MPEITLLYNKSYPGQFLVSCFCIIQVQLFYYWFPYLRRVRERYIGGFRAHHNRKHFAHGRVSSEIYINQIETYPNVTTYSFVFYIILSGVLLTFYQMETKK